MTAMTTPPKSPVTIRECGQRLLPKIRDQDQYLDNYGLFLPHTHNRTISTPNNFLHYQTADGLFLPLVPPPKRRRGALPKNPTLLVPPPASVPISGPNSAPIAYDHSRFSPCAPWGFADENTFTNQSPSIQCL